MLAPTLSLVAREVVGNDDVARAQRRAQKGFDPRQKQGAIDRPIADHRRCQRITAQGCNEGAGFPVPMRSAALAQRCHAGAAPGLVQKYQASGIKPGLLLYPALPCLLHVFTRVFAGVLAFF